MSFKALYSLCDAFSKKIICEYENEDIEQTIQIRTNALYNATLPLVAVELIAPSSSSLSLYAPISKENYMRGLTVQGIARINLVNTYSRRNKVITCGLGLYDQNYYMFVSVDTPQELDLLPDIYNDIIDYINELASNMQLLHPYAERSSDLHEQQRADL